MTIAIGQKQDLSVFDLEDDWLKRDRFVFNDTLLRRKIPQDEYEFTFK
jgi:hypothetical protein